MLRREIVERAITFKDPPRVPIFMFNRDFDKSDVRMLTYAQAKSFTPKRHGESEWGYVQESVDKTAGQITASPIEDWADLENYVPPVADLPERFEHIKNFVGTTDQFIIGDLGISGFSKYTFLRGFENTMTDFYLEEENMNRLLDIIFSFEETVIERMLQCGADAISFYDDWGSQKSLFVSLDMWRKFFKERYRRQFDLIKKYNRHIFFHSCGYVMDIIPELIELGVDIVNFNGLEVMGLENVAKYRGKLCFCCPVDLQSVAIKADRRQIFDYTKRMIEELGTPHGGYMGYIEEYSSIGLTDENYWNCYDAYQEYGTYRK